MVADVRDDFWRNKPAAVMWMWGVLALLGLMTKPAQAGDGGLDARAWMDKVVTAALQLNYEGTFIYRRDDQLVAMRIIHVADGQKERERLIALSGRPREIIRDADGTVCILPEQKQVRMSVGLNKHFPPRALDNPAVLEKYYRFTVGGADRIAGRSARMVVIEPRDRYRYGYRIWIDEGSGLLLQSDLVDENGNAVEQVMFTDINLVTSVTPAMAQAVVITDDMRKAMAKSTAPQPVPSKGGLSWSVARAPAGFKLAEQYRHRNRAGALMEHGVLTDGMASVSVFVEPLEAGQQAFEGVSHMGAVSAFGAVVNARQLTVVGEVPVGTVQQIGRSITFDTQSDDK